MVRSSLICFSRLWRIIGIILIIGDCEPVLISFWSKIVDPQKWSQFASRGFQSWLKWNLASQELGPFSTPWATIFGVAIDALWRARKSLIF